MSHDLTFQKGLEKNHGPLVSISNLNLPFATYVDEYTVLLY